MKISSTLVSITNFILVWAGTSSGLALPARPLYLTPRSTLSASSRRSLTTTLLLNAPAFQDPSNSSNTIAAFEAFDFITQPNLTPITGLVNNTLNTLGLGDVGNKLTTAVDRLKLFAAVGVPAVHVDVDVAGCTGNGGGTVELPRTGVKDLGVVSANVSIGSCAAASSRSISASVANPATNASTMIFPSLPSGFGIISDIDDTIKVSDVLNTSLLIQNTLFNDPVPVSGMPELYGALAESLAITSSSSPNEGGIIPPQFIYLSGSPIQLYPFLTSFLQSTFPPSTQGPLLLQNFSVTDPTLILNSFGDGGSGQGKIDYKVGQINNINGMYPDKSFLAIGDSTEKDPEVYGLSFNIHGGSFIKCIWIHVVDGANNTDARFAAAFEGVPQERIRLYKDEDIAGLKDVNVQGGSC